MKSKFVFMYTSISIFGVVVLIIIPLFIEELKLIYTFVDMGFDHFKTIVYSRQVIISINNTFKFMVINIPVVVMLGFFLAFIVVEQKNRDYLILVLISPILIPAVSVGGVFSKIYSDFLMNAMSEFTYLSFVFIWSAVSYTFLIYYVALLNRDKSIEEAAYVDGANEIIVITRILFPSLHKATVLSLIISVYNATRVFKYSYSIWGEHPNVQAFMIQNFLNNNIKALEITKMMVGFNIFLLMIILLLLPILIYGKVAIIREEM